MADAPSPEQKSRLIGPDELKVFDEISSGPRRCIHAWRETRIDLLRAGSRFRFVRGNGFRCCLPGRHCRNASRPCRRTAHDAGFHGGDQAVEPTVVGASVPDRHRRRHAGDQRDALRHTVDRDAHRHPLRQADPSIDGVDIRQSLRAGRRIRHADAARHAGHMPEDGFGVSPSASPRLYRRYGSAPSWFLRNTLPKWTAIRDVGPPTQRPSETALAPSPGAMSGQAIARWSSMTSAGHPYEESSEEIRANAGAPKTFSSVTSRLSKDKTCERLGFSQ
jgi:hypothetical protein